MPAVTESDLELATLAWFADLGYEVLPTEALEPGGPDAERQSLEDVILVGRLTEAIRRLNPALDENAIADVVRGVLKRDAPKVAGYHQFHAVRRAVEETARAVGAEGDRRIGVVWHTQGSGTLARYRTRSITSVEVIEELMALAGTIRERDAAEKGRKLTEEESAFFDALADNDSAVEALKDEGLAAIARELTAVVHRMTTVDWNRKESVRARLRIELKKVLKRCGYPPDGRDEAVKLVLAQAESLGINITEGGSAAPAPRDDADAEAPGATEALPYPIAFFDGLIQGQPNPALRVKARRDAFDKAMVFLAGLGLALLRERDALPEKVAKTLARFAGKPISMGGWFELACVCAASLPEDAKDPLVRSVRALVTPGGDRSALALAIAEHVIPERNAFAHTVTPSEEAATEDEERLADLWRQLERALDGLRSARLVARAGLVDHDPTGGAAKYKVRQLHGNATHFLIREEIVRGKLEEGWAYVLRGEKPLSLAPVIACAAIEGGTRHDVFVADQVDLAGEKPVTVVRLSGDEKRGG